jgi:hypothetical protein
MTLKTVLVDPDEFNKNCSKLRDAILKAIEVELNRMKIEDGVNCLAAEVHTAVRMVLWSYSNALGPVMTKYLEGAIRIADLLEDTDTSGDPC